MTDQKGYDFVTPSCCSSTVKSPSLVVNYSRISSDSNSKDRRRKRKMSGRSRSSDSSSSSRETSSSHKSSKERITKRKHKAKRHERSTDNSGSGCDSSCSRKESNKKIHKYKQAGKLTDPCKEREDKIDKMKRIDKKKKKEKRKKEKKREKRKKKKKKREHSSSSVDVTMVSNIGPNPTQSGLSGLVSATATISVATVARSSIALAPRAAADSVVRRVMKPMTKEEWDQERSAVRRVYESETGRTRLVKGNGEIIEEIVTKEQHKKINKRATACDGQFYQKTAMRISDEYD